MLAGERRVSIVVVVYVDTGVRFLPGRIVSTPGAIAAFGAAGEDMAAYLERHLHGGLGRRQP